MKEGEVKKMNNSEQQELIILKYEAIQEFVEGSVRTSKIISYERFCQICSFDEDPRSQQMFDLYKALTHHFNEFDFDALIALSEACPE